MNSLRHAIAAVRQTLPVRLPSDLHLPQTSLSALMRVMRAPAISYLRPDHPENRAPGWSNNLQGVTHNADHWFFTQEQVLWKFPVRHDLSTEVSDRLPRGVHKVQMPTLQEFGEPATLFAAAPSPSPGFGSSASPVPPPTPLQWYDHFGDLDYFDGHLFVPVTGVQVTPRIAVFDAGTLALVASQALRDPAGEPINAGWCAINPLDGLLYTSRATISHEKPVYTFRVALHARRRTLTLTPAGTYHLFDAQGRFLTLTRMQGGVFSPDGHAYLVNGYMEDFAPSQGGVHVFFAPTGVRLTKSRHDVGPFQFEFHPGHWRKIPVVGHVVEWLGGDGDWIPIGNFDEPEGITLWDLDDGRAPGIRGQLHVMMVNNDFQAFNDDDLYFKHYRVA